MVKQARLLAAYHKVRDDLLAEQSMAGHWEGRLSSSPLSTATAISALTLVERHDPTDARSGRFVDESRESMLIDYIVGSLRWLARQQNADGGWGDTDRSHSNIATTMLAVAAFHLTGVPADRADLLERAERYIRAQGGIRGLRRRYGKDKTFAIPILANCAFADLVRWKDVAALPFELACLPQRFYRWARLPVVSYAIPALVAVGQARYFQRKPRNPVLRVLRSLAVEPSMEVLRGMLPESGGYLEAIPLTSFVVMSLAGTGRATHPVTRRGVDFLISTRRDDGSWPIDTNLATWNTTLATHALSTAGDDPGASQRGCAEWLLDCQHRRPHPYTGAEPGGWGWSELSGAVPDVDDTAGAVLALNRWRRSPGCGQHQKQRILAAAARGLRWLRDLQNSDGGWPTFCRGWGKLPFDRSGADLTAHALRALHAWRDVVAAADAAAAIAKGLQFLAQRQNSDGSWTPLWFGNQDHPQSINRVYGTAKVLMAYRDLGQLDNEPARRALAWLRREQNVDGGWGSGLAEDESGAEVAGPSSIEETALAIEALMSVHHEPTWQDPIDRGLDWLIGAVESGRHATASPIGLYFAKLWYYERLYPLIFATSALGEAVGRLVPSAARQTTEVHVLTG